MDGVELEEGNYVRVKTLEGGKVTVDFEVLSWNKCYKEKETAQTKIEINYISSEICIFGILPILICSSLCPPLSSSSSSHIEGPQKQHLFTSHILRTLTITT